MPEYEREEVYRPIDGFPVVSLGLRGNPPNHRRKKVELYVTVEEFQQIRRAAADLRIPITDLLRRYVEPFWQDLENGTITEEADRLRDSED